MDLNLDDYENDIEDINDVNFDDDMLIYRYEVGTIINGNRNTICATNDLEIANDFYEKAIKNHSPHGTTNHVIVFLYDYDLNTNKNYYDSEFDIC